MIWCFIVVIVLWLALNVAYIMGYIKGLKEGTLMQEDELEEESYANYENE